MTKRPEICWIQYGIVAGICTSVAYPVILMAQSLPLALTASVLMGPAIGIGSLGLRQLLIIHHRTVSASLGALFNVLAGTVFTIMIFVQMAVYAHVPGVQPKQHLVGIWLGIDVAWDVYIGLGTLFFAWAMIKHPRFRWPFALPGFMLGLAVLMLNLLTFPTPPAEAGSLDVGPFVGLWYLAATIQAWRSLSWARSQLPSVNN